jgi:hypothetical protein
MWLNKRLYVNYSKLDAKFDSCLAMQCNVMFSISSRTGESAETNDINVRWAPKFRGKSASFHSPKNFRRARIGLSPRQLWESPKLTNYWSYLLAIALFSSLSRYPRGSRKLCMLSADLPRSTDSTISRILAGLYDDECSSDHRSFTSDLAGYPRGNSTARNSTAKVHGWCETDT